MTHGLNSPSRRKSLRARLQVEYLEDRWTPAAGDLDVSLGGTGKVLTDFGADLETGADMAIQADGKIVVVGSTGDGNSSDFAIARFLPDGTLDTSFDFDGKVTTDYGNGSYDIANDVAIDANGRIIVVGSSTLDSGFAIARYNSDGSLDDNFGTGGKILTGFISGTSRSAHAVVLDANGNILVAGRNSESFPGTDRFAVARYDTNGAPDPNFGFAGIQLISFGSDTADSANSIAIDLTGKIVVAGSTSALDPNQSFFVDDWAIARLHTDGTPDATFGVDGKLAFEFGSDVESINSVAIDANNRIVAAGYAHHPTTSFDMSVARINMNGSFDSSWDSDGKLRIEFGNGSDAHTVAIDGDGKILLAGSSELEFAVLRYNADGTPDNSFSGDGKLTTNFGSEFAQAEGMAVDAEGKIVVVGTAEKDLALVRYLTTGGDGGVGTAEIVSGDLVVTGTTGDDAVKVRPAKDKTQLEVRFGRTAVGTFALSAITGAIVVNAREGNDKVAISSKITKPAHLNGGVGNDTLTGGSGFDRLSGDAGDDRLKGKAGDDVYLYVADWGIDKISESGTGVDQIDFTAYSQPLSFLRAGNLKVAAGANALTATGKVEEFVGGSAVDTLTSAGGRVQWLLTGANSGQMKKIAFAGVENLVGSRGKDTLSVKPGGNLSGTFDGGGGTNDLDYSAYTSEVFVSLAVGAASATGGISNVINVRGGTAPDILIGNDLNNILSGGAGRDILIGRGGADRLFGEADDDILIAGSTTLDSDPLDLVALLDKWTSGSTYAERVFQLSSAENILTPNTVTDDANAGDQLSGGTEQDWFWIGTDDKIIDLETAENEGV